MCGAIPPHPKYVFMGWFLVKHSSNFTFTHTMVTYILKVDFSTELKWDIQQEN
jgi:hypothetical protein